MAYNEKGGTAVSVAIKNLSFSYGSHEVLKDVSFSVKDGEILSVLGCNGAGKSTLLRCVLGLMPKYGGSIEINGRDIQGMSPYEMSRQIAYIPQSHYHAFNFSVLNMVLMGTSSQVSAFSPPKKQQKMIAEDAMERMGIAHLAKKSFSNISGGERQLTLIARALAQDVRLLVMDEPTANLDYGNQLRVMEQAKSLAGEGYTIIQSSHHPEQAYLFSDHIIALKNGAVLGDGLPAKIISKELMQDLYNADVKVHSLYNDRMRVLIPMQIIK